MGGIHIGWEVKSAVSLCVSLVNQMHFPNTGKRIKDQNLLYYIYRLTVD